MLRRRIGFIFQDFKLLNNKTVYQNVALAMEVIGERPVLIKKRAHQALRSVGLEKKEKAFPLELSGGEQQRVAIARALVNNPSIILADEPTGNLDTRTGFDIIRLMKRLNEERGQTFVVVTHDPAIAETADRIIYLKDGLAYSKGMK